MQNILYQRLNFNYNFTEFGKKKKKKKVADDNISAFNHVMTSCGTGIHDGFTLRRMNMESHFTLSNFYYLRSEDMSYLFRLYPCAVLS